MRKGFAALAAQAEQPTQQYPFNGQMFVFRARQGDLNKIIWWDGRVSVLNTAGEGSVRLAIGKGRQNCADPGAVGDAVGNDVAPCT